jgi:hypothetical protein
VIPPYRGSARPEDKVIDAATVSAHSLREKILIPVVVSLVVSLLTSVVIWSWQQDRLQRWASQVVVDIQITSDKALAIRNLGAVDLSDVAVYFSQYVIGVKQREAGHLYITGKIESVSKSGTPLVRWARIESYGGEVRFPLASNIMVFYKVGSGHDFEAARQHYALRVLFHNAITKQKHVYYAITSAAEGPSMFDFASGAAFGGPYDGSRTIIAIRQAIRAHQAELFDDGPQDLYR